MSTLSSTMRCQSCGATNTLPMTVTTTAGSGNSVEVRLRLDPADLAWLRLYADAHRGPFVPARR